MGVARIAFLFIILLCNQAWATVPVENALTHVLTNVCKPSDNNSNCGGGSSSLTGSISGTSNQVNVTANSNSVGQNITLSTPQNISTTDSVTFGNVTDSAMTVNSILYAGTGGLISADHSNLYWDFTNHRLGLGDTSPSKLLSVGSGHLFTVDGSGITLINGNSGGFLTVTNTVPQYVAANTSQLVNSTAEYEFQITDGGGTVKRSGDIGVIATSQTAGSQTADMFFKTIGTGSLVERLRITGAGQFNIWDGGNFSLGTGTGTDIATATNQLLGFYGATPIVQPSGNVCTSLQNLGLITSCTESGGAVSSVSSGGGIYDPTVSPTTGSVVVSQKNYAKTILAVAAANMGGGA